MRLLANERAHLYRLDEGEAVKLLVAAEDIAAGTIVVRAIATNYVYAVDSMGGDYMGRAVENLRSGFRVAVENEEVREDDG